MRALVLSLLLVASCPSRTSPPPTTPVGNTGTQTGNASQVVVTLERTACFGFCPIYKVAVREDLTVEYEGERFVKVIGRASGTIEQAQLDALMQAARDLDYFALKDAYDEYRVTDLPSAITSFTIDGQTKRVSHYFGDDTAPEGLTKLEDEIDRVLGTEQWIGTEQEREALRSKWR